MVWRDALYIQVNENEKEFMVSLVTVRRGSDGILRMKFRMYELSSIRASLTSVVIPKDVITTLLNNVTSLITKIGSDMRWVSPRGSK